MKTVRIDFVKRRAQPVMGLGLLTAGVSGVLLCGLHFQSHTERQAARRQTMVELQVKRDIAQAKADKARLAIQAEPAYLRDQRWLKASNELNLPWMRALGTVEKVTKPPVFLTGIKALPEGNLQLDAEAPDLKTALHYLTQIQTTGGMNRAQLLSHQDSSDASGARIVRFTLTTPWVNIP